MHKRKSLKVTIVACTIAGIMTFTPVVTNADQGSTTSKTEITYEALVYRRPLRQGLSGEDVRKLQESLKTLGFLDINNCTTYFGSMTRNALLNFQRSSGIAVDGSAGPATYRTINKALNNSNKTSPTSPKNIQSSSKSKSQTLVYGRPLRQGLSGQDVRELQESLKTLGFLDINNCTTYFGSMTRNALLNFQRSSGIAVDGSAGPATYRTINKALNGTISKPDASSNRGSVSRNTGSNIVSTARQYLGSAYRSGGASPSGFDCSGFTYYVYKQLGITLPRSSSGQAGVGTRVSKSNLQPGDLLIFSNTYKSGPSHSGIYLGNGNFIHSANARTGVIINTINSGYWQNHFSYGRRAH